MGEWSSRRGSGRFELAGQVFVDVGGGLRAILVTRDSVVAVGERLAVSTDTLTYVSRPAPDSVCGIVQDAGGNIYVVTTRGSIFVTSDCGAIWRRLVDFGAVRHPLVSQPAGIVRATLLARTDDGRLWVGGDNGYCGWWEPDERWFRRVDLGTDVDQLAVLAVADIVYLAGADGALRIVRGGVVRTVLVHDGGPLTALACTGRGTLLAMGDDGFLARSADGGDTFTVVDAGDFGLRAAAGLPGGRVAGVGRGGIHLSDDDGATFTTVHHNADIGYPDCLAAFGSGVLVGTSYDGTAAAGGAAEPADPGGGEILRLAVAGDTMWAERGHLVPGPRDPLAARVVVEGSAIRRGDPRVLTEEEALAYLRPHEARRAGPVAGGPQFDAECLAYGSSDGRGALLLPGGRFDWLELPPEHIGQSIFIEGDLVVDGCLHNDGLLFVTGGITARDLCNEGYLVVMGDVVAQRVVGVDERYGTFVFGDLSADQFVMWGNHQYMVGGTTNCATVVHDEADGMGDVLDVLSGWGVPCPHDGVDWDALLLFMRAAGPAEQVARLRSSMADLPRIDVARIPQFVAGAFDDLPDLRRLSLSGLDLSGGTLPDGTELGVFLVHLAGDTGLLELDLSRTNLTQWPPTSAAMPALRALDLSVNHLDRLPDNVFAGTPRLRKLDLHGNSLSTLPESFYALTALEEVHIDLRNLDAPTRQRLAARTRAEPDNPAHDWFRAVIVALHLRTGRTDDAYRTAQQILTRRPHFPGLADIADSAPFQAWQRQPS